MIEVGAEAEDPLQTFGPEPGSAPIVENRSDARLDALPPGRPERSVTARSGAGWRDGLLLFLSGAMVGVLCAIVPSLDWPVNAETSVKKVQPSLETEHSRTPALGAPASTSPAPTSGTTTSSGRAREAVPPATNERTVPGLSASSGYRGTLRVSSQPRGASIFINERYVGRTPMVIRALPVGSRAVRLRLDGYGPWSRGVNIVANEFTTVAAKLNRSKTSE